MGKAIVIIFAAISLIIIPISLYYIADTSIPTNNYTLEFQGRFFNAKVGQDSGFGFFKFVTPSTNFFNPTAWNQAYPNDVVLGLPAGTWMMILWYVGIGLLLVGIIVAFFKVKIAGIFFVLAFLIDGMQSLIWFLGMKAEVAGDPTILYFPIPLSALFLLVTFILAFTSKKKESYYYSPGYSYGYGRR